MAKRIEEILLDDIDGGDAHETVVFTIDGSTYEIDLHEKKAENLRLALAPFITKARPVRASNGVGRRTRGTGRAGAIDRQKSADIRSWAKTHGLPVSERGRIAATVVEQYDAAH